VSSCAHFEDPHALHALPEGQSVDRVAIAEKVGWRGVVRERLHELLGRPGRGGMLGHVEVEDPPPMVGEHDENEEDAQVGGGHREEIGRDQVPDMVGEERAPGLRRRGVTFRDQPGDGPLADVDAKLLEFAVNSGGAPQGIRRSHSQDEAPDLDVDGRTTPGGGAGQSSPVGTEASPPPPEHGGWRDDDEGILPPGPHPGQTDPDKMKRLAIP
jgi:hypothetical protein